MSSDTKKNKALSAITQIDRQFGKGSIMRLGRSILQQWIIPFQQDVCPLMLP